MGRLFVILSEAKWRCCSYRSLDHFSYCPFSSFKMQLAGPTRSQSPRLSGKPRVKHSLCARMKSASEERLAPALVSRLRQSFGRMEAPQGPAFFRIPSFRIKLGLVQARYKTWRLLFQLKTARSQISLSDHLTALDLANQRVTYFSMTAVVGRCAVENASQKVRTVNIIFHIISGIFCCAFSDTDRISQLQVQQSMNLCWSIVSHIFISNGKASE